MSSRSLKHISTFYNSKYWVEYKDVKIDASCTERILIKEYLVLKSYYLTYIQGVQPIPVDTRSEARVCDRPLPGILGLNSTGYSMWMFVYFEWCVLSSRGLCFGPITHPEDSYRVWFVKWAWSWSPDNEEDLAPRGFCVMAVEKYGECIQKFALLERLAKLHSACIREI